MEIKQARQDAPLNENPQDISIKFSFCTLDDSSVTRLHEFVKCRDFLGDVVMANKAGISSTIYGFRVTPEELKVNPDKTQLILKFPKVNYKKFLSNYTKLHEIEEKNGFELTKVIAVDDEHIVVIGDKWWQQSIFGISLYTYLLKVFSIPSKKDIWESLGKRAIVEASYYKNTKHILFDVFNILHKLDLSDPTGNNYTEIRQIHNYSGFVSHLCNYLNKTELRKQIDGLLQ